MIKHKQFCFPALLLLGCSLSGCSNNPGSSTPSSVSTNPLESNSIKRAQALQNEQKRKLEAYQKNLQQQRMQSYSNDAHFNNQ